MCCQTFSLSFKTYTVTEGVNVLYHRKFSGEDVVIPGHLEASLAATLPCQVELFRRFVCSSSKLPGHDYTVAV
jgi:hypothetical protein